MSKYIIYSKNITNGFQEELAQQEFEELSKSKEILGEVFAKEKIYNIILMNYYEFEKELFEITLEDEIFNSDYANFSEYISKAEQRILNLLSSITLYLDSFKDDLKGTQKYSTYLKNEFTDIVNYLNEARTDNKQVEIMRLLRNHIQHNGLLITNFSLNGVNLTDELREQTHKI
jgi:intein/homing endonuclease